MEQPKEDKFINESASAASISGEEKASESVESPLEEQQVAQMECDVAAVVGTTTREQEAPQDMDCQVSAAPGTPSAAAVRDQEKPATISATISAIPQVQPAPEAVAGTAPASGLSLLAAYSSDAEDSDVEEVTQIHDSDNEVVEVPVTDSTASTTAYRRPVVAVSSGSDSSDSSSSDSDSDSEGEYLTVLRKKIDKRINTEECDEEDEDDEEGATGDKSRRRQPPKVRGEMLLDELPPIHQLEITVPEDECVELGKVQSIVDQLVLVSVLPNSMLFDLDTVLFLEKGRKVLGQVFDVLGQVADPIYCVRFNSNQQILDRGIKIGDVVYCAPKTEHTQFVILSKLMQVRGSDASWEHDVEPPARYVDYSDDEEERRLETSSENVASGIAPTLRTLWIRSLRWPPRPQRLLRWRLLLLGSADGAGKERASGRTRGQIRTTTTINSSPWTSSITIIPATILAAGTPTTTTTTIISRRPTSTCRHRHRNMGCTFQYPIMAIPCPMPSHQ